LSERFRSPLDESDGGAAWQGLSLSSNLLRAAALARCENDLVHGGLGGIGLSEERQLKGYRVRLRVVEEYDVALLARSAEDARARAEADVRRGDRFVDIQDSWPEEIIAVESLAVEPYPELE
jgi:hypothetical protein